MPEESQLPVLAISTTVSSQTTQSAVVEREVTDCWNTIGVRGDGSCPELARHTHCRNCPVYSRAALCLLDRPQPPEHRHEWSRHFAKPRSGAAVTRTSVVIFRIGSDWLALPSETLQEVAERRLIHSLPHQQRGVVLGLVNIRGELAICVSVDRLLGIQPATQREGLPRAAGRLLVASMHGSRCIFPADEVHGVHRLHANELSDPPASFEGAKPGYTRGIFNWRGKPVGLLDAGQLFAALNRNF